MNEMLQFKLNYTNKKQTFCKNKNLIINIFNIDVMMINFLL